MRRGRGLQPALALLGAAALVISGCGTSKTTSGGSTTGTASFSGHGPITFATGKDTSGIWKTQFDLWNKDHPTEKISLIELPESADQQRQQMIQNAQTKSDAYTILNLDVVWTSEFASNQWILPLPKDQFPTDKMLAPTVATATYFNKLYAVPNASDGGLLYYRTDLLSAAGLQPPKTWSDMLADCKKIQAMPQGKGLGCYAGQFEKYEGLTVNFAEAVQSAGGHILTSDGKADVNTPEAKKGLSFLADGFKQGYIPKEAITYKEEEGRRAFQDGKLIFHRQWPYQYALANKTDGSSKVAGKFAVAPLPGADGPGSSSLGGHNLAISSFAKNKGTALDFMKWLTTEDRQKEQLKIASNAPVFASLYDDPDLQKQFPYLSMLKASILSAQPRPKAPNYGDVTAVIQDNAYAALKGDKTVDQALSDMQSQLQAAIAKK